MPPVTPETVDLTSDALRAFIEKSNRKAAKAAAKEGAAEAVRAIKNSDQNAPEPGSRPGGNPGANVNLDRPVRLSVAKAIIALREGSWVGSELERDFGQATRSLYSGSHPSESSSFFYPSNPLAYVDVITQAAINVEHKGKLVEWAARAVRAAAEGSTSAGGALVPAAYMQDQFVLSLQTAVAFRNTPGHDTIPVPSPLTYWPRETVMPTSGAYAEAAIISATDATFAQQAITVKKQSALNQFSNELLADSTPAYEAYIGRSMSRSLALFIDLQDLEGTGTGANILGMGSYSGLSAGYSVGTNGDAWGQSYASSGPVLPGTEFSRAMITAARNAGFEPNAWIMRPDVLASLQGVLDGNGRYILESVGGVFGAPVIVPNVGTLPTQATYQTPPWKGMLFGIPVFLTTQIPVNEHQGDATDCSHVFLGDFNFARTIERQSVEMAISDQIYFTTDQTAVRVSARTAIVLLEPAAFIKQSGVRAATS